MEKAIIRWYDWVMIGVALCFYLFSKNEIWKPMGGFFVVFMVFLYAHEKLVSYLDNRKIYKDRNLNK